jgi:antitoxin PrlF
VRRRWRAWWRVVRVCLVLCLAHRLAGDVRTAANLKPGDRIHFTVLADGTIIVRVKNRSIRDIALKPPGGKRVSIAQMNR